MQMIPVGSANLVAVGWEPYPWNSQPASTLTPEECVGDLQIEFKTATYKYLGVPWQVYEELLEASSKGQYFNEHIKDSYEWEQLD